MISEVRLASLRREIARIVRSEEDALDCVKKLAETNWEEVFTRDLVVCDECQRTYQYVHTHRNQYTGRRICLACYQYRNEADRLRYAEIPCLGCKQIFRKKYSEDTLCYNCKHDQRIQQEYHKVSAHRKRARNRGLDQTLQIEEWLVILDAFQWKCAYCRTSPYEIFEHFIPIVYGGGTTADNCIPACNACSKLKGMIHPEDLLLIPREDIERVQAYLASKAAS